MRSSKNIFTSDLPINTSLSSSKEIQNVILNNSLENYQKSAETHSNVFKSEIPVNTTTRDNNLYDLLNCTFDIPKPLIEANKRNDNLIQFIPKTGKFFTSKRISKSKVKTLKSIRKEYEDYFLTYLDNDLKNQQRFLMRKVRDGSAREIKTIASAKHLLNGDTPLSRSSFRMLVNLNPNGVSCPVQFVLCSGKKIRINGATGGKNLFLVNHDLSIKQKSQLVVKTGNDNCTRKRSILESSVKVEFKPGPLSKKSKLDQSYQKYNVGAVKLSKLPPIGIQVNPRFGSIIEPFVLGFLKKMKEGDDVITDKWAQFAVASLGSVVNNKLVQKNEDNLIFPLEYTNQQNRIIMRNTEMRICMETNENQIPTKQLSNEEYLIKEVESFINDIISAVEINVDELKFFKEDNDMVTGPSNDTVNKDVLNYKEKGKFKFSELHRLDITLIKCPDANDTLKKDCSKSFCLLGCICSSLESTYIVRGHCGKPECMFGCQCYSKHYDGRQELIPGLANLENAINSNLAKEEQKFHQTVVFKENDSIFLGPKRRQCKSFKKYDDFVYNSRTKPSEDIKKRQMRKFTIFLNRLELSKVEPWCMVHHVYKCFCKGKFPDTYISESSISSDKEILQNKCDIEMPTIEKYVPCYQNEDKVSELKNNSTEVFTAEVNNEKLLYLNSKLLACSRIQPYSGRKYNDSFYLENNRKIIDMEINDFNLQKKLSILIQNSLAFKDDSEICEKNLDDIVPHDHNDDGAYSPWSIDGFPSYIDIEQIHQRHITNKTLNSEAIEISESKVESKCISNDNADDYIPSLCPKGSQLASWLENHYKNLKKKMKQNASNLILGAPKVGSVILFPFEEISKRYKLKKNIFFVMESKPHRVFMAVDPSLSEFDCCVRLENIRSSSFRKYPLTVKQIVRTKCAKQNTFYILSGRKNCWEIIGSVTKTKESDDSHKHQPLSSLENKAIVRSVAEITDLSEKINEEKTLSLENSETLKSVTNIKDLADNMTDQMPLSLENSAPKPSGLLSENIKRKTCISGNSSKRQSEIEDMVSAGNLNLTESHQSSRWFVLSVKKDFDEIRFYNAGFFVRYDKIKNAIDAAEKTGEAILLSAPSYPFEQFSLQFGIYAIPTFDSTVFIGPYPEGEPLGFGIINNACDSKYMEEIYGYSITMPNVDGGSLIENLKKQCTKNVDGENCSETIGSVTKTKELSDEHEPLSSLENKDIVRSVTEITDLSEKISEEKTLSLNLKKDLVKTAVILPKKDDIAVKSQIPILPKIVETVSLKDLYNVNDPSINESAPHITILPKMVDTDNLNTSNLNNPNIIKCTWTYDNASDSTQKIISPPKMVTPLKHIKPITIKKTNGFYHLESDKFKKPISLLKLTSPPPLTISKDNLTNPSLLLKPKIIPSITIPSTSSSTGDTFMKILKPSEINEKLLVHKPSGTNDELDDVEHFIASTPALSTIERDVFIESTNVNGLGHLLAKSKGSFLSFQFPGFQFSNYYKKESVFIKINQILSRKVCVPFSIKVRWRVVEDAVQLKNKNLMKLTDFDTDMILTTDGLHRIKRIISNSEQLVNAVSDPKVPATKSITMVSKPEVLELEGGIQVEIDDIEKQNPTKALIGFRVEQVTSVITKPEVSGKTSTKTLSTQKVSTKKRANKKESDVTAKQKRMKDVIAFEIEAEKVMREIREATKKLKYGDHSATNASSSALAKIRPIKSTDGECSNKQSRINSSDAVIVIDDD